MGMLLMVACPFCRQLIERKIGMSVMEMAEEDSNDDTVESWDYDEPFKCPHCGRTIDPAKDKFTGKDDKVAFFD